MLIFYRVWCKFHEVEVDEGLRAFLSLSRPITCKDVQFGHGNLNSLRRSQPLSRSPDICTAHRPASSVFTGPPPFDQAHPGTQMLSPMNNLFSPAPAATGGEHTNCTLRSPQISTSLGCQRGILWSVTCGHRFFFDIRSFFFPLRITQPAPAPLAPGGLQVKGCLPLPCQGCR